jgi:hypothetical protein
MSTMTPPTARVGAARVACFALIGGAWSMALVCAGVAAGWVFIALRGAGLASLADQSLAAIPPERLSVFVGGQITRGMFDVVLWISLLMPAVLVTVLGGWSGKRFGLLPARGAIWLQRGAVIALSASLLAAIISLQLSLTLGSQSQSHWEAAASGDAAATASTRAVLDATHVSAERTYGALTLLAFIGTACGCAALVRRSALPSTA